MTQDSLVVLITGTSRSIPARGLHAWTTRSTPWWDVDKTRRRPSCHFLDGSVGCSRDQPEYQLRPRASPEESISIRLKAAPHSQGPQAV